MQLIYGNDGTNYHTIAKSKRMTSVQEKKLLDGYKKYDFVEDSSLYSSPVEEPTALTYVTTDLSGTLEKEQILLAYNARMTNYTADSYYAHFRFWNASKILYGKDFISLLLEDFVSDTALNDYNDENIDDFDKKRNDYSPDISALEEDELIAIVSALLYAVDKKGYWVQLILDVAGDGYNKRARDVIASVYSYVPYNIRKKAGFCTYSTSGKNELEQIKLMICPCGKVKNTDKIVVRVFKYDRCYQDNIVGKEMAEFAKIIVEAEPKGREEWFLIFQKAFQLKDTSVKEHITLFWKAKKWKNESLKDILDELASYFYKERDNGKDSVVCYYRSIVEKRFENEHDNIEYFRATIKEELDSQNTFAFSQHMQEYIMFGENVSQVDFCQSDFLEWEQRKILEPLIKDYPNERERYIELEKKLQELLEIQKNSYGAHKYKKIDLGMKKQLERELEELTKQIEKQIVEEKEAIERFMDEVDPVAENYGIIWDQYKTICYEENQSSFKEMLCEKMEEILNGLHSYESYMKFMYLSRAILGQERYDELCREAESIVEVLKPAYYNTSIRWNNQKDVWKSFIELSENCQDQEAVISECKLAAEREVKQERDKDVKLTIGDTAFDINYEDLMLIEKFLTEEGKQKCPDILKNNGQLLKSLLTIGVFNLCHLPELGSITDRELQKDILYYYGKKADMLSYQDIMKNIVDMASKMALFQIEECAAFADRLEKLQTMWDSDKTAGEDETGISLQKRGNDRIQAVLYGQDSVFDPKDISNSEYVPIPEGTSGSKDVSDSGDVPESEIVSELEDICVQAGAYELDSICWKNEEGKTEPESRAEAEGIEHEECRVTGEAGEQMGVSVMGKMEEKLKIIWYSLFIPMVLFLLTVFLKYCFKLPDTTALMIPEVVSGVAAISITCVLRYFIRHGRYVSKILLSCVIGFLIALPMSVLAWIIF